MFGPPPNPMNKLRILTDINYMTNISRDCSAPLYERFLKVEHIVKTASFHFQVQYCERTINNIWREVPVEMIQNKENSNEENITNFFIMYEDIIEDILDSILA